MQEGRQRTLTPIAVPPGLVKDATDAAATGYWRDGVNVRWKKVRDKFFVKKIGGFAKSIEQTYRGSARKLHMWKQLDGTALAAVGTHTNLYILRQNELGDRTPLKATHNTVDSISTTAGSVAFTVNLGAAPHGAVVGDYVFIDPSAGVGGIPEAGLTGEFVIVEIVDDYKFICHLANPAISTATGGGSVIVEMVYPTGLDHTIYGDGWGAGGWGRDGWGEEATIGSVATSRLALWSMDNFGQDLYACRRGSPIFRWTPTAPQARAKSLRDEPLAAGLEPPKTCEFVLVSEMDGHVIGFGCDEVMGDGTQNPLHIRWSSQLDPFDWKPTTTNTSRGLTLSKGSRIVAVVQTRQQILVFTDRALYTLTYTGGTYVFASELVAENISIMGPNAVVAVGDTVFWMGKKGFFRYDGNVSPIPCDLQDWLDTDLNKTEFEKVNAGFNILEREVWWFYPSGENADCNRGVFMSIDSGAFSLTSFGRTAWYDGDYTAKPLGANGGILYDHETGSDDFSTSPPTAIPAFVESASIELGDGTDLMFCDRIVYDVDFKKSQSAACRLHHILKGFDWPGDAQSKNYETTARKTAILPYEHTAHKSIRIRARALTLRVESVDVGADWQLGVPRIRVRSDGERA